MQKERNKKKILVTIIAGPQNGQKFEFSKDQILVGRLQDCDLWINDPGVSRKHFEFLLGDAAVMVRKITDKNYLLVDDYEVNEKIIVSGTKIKVGETIMLVEFPMASMSAQIGLLPKAKPNLTPSENSSPPLNTYKNYSHQGAGNVLPTQPMKNPSPLNQSLPKGEQTNLPYFIVMTLVAIIVFGGYFFFSSADKMNTKTQKDLKLRTDVLSQKRLELAEEEFEKLKKEKFENKNPGFEKAQELFLKGFRDYRSGNFIRAMEQFAAALTFDPNHTQAKRYYSMASRRQQEFIQQQMNAGKKYYQNQNYRMCENHYAIVLKSIRDDKDPLRKEALHYWKECKTRKEMAF